MGTHYKGKPAEVRALNTFIKLMRAANTVSSRLERRLGEAGLTENQFGVLEILLHLGPQCQRDLGTRLLTSGGNITMVVDNLEKRGLVRRERSEEDRRYISVHLTPTGRRLIADLFPGHAATITKLLSTLDAGEQDELAALCKKLGVGVARTD